MLKSIGSIQLALATIFVVPAVTGQDEGVATLESQLDATISSLEYLAGLRNGAEAGETGALRAIVAATETPREATPQRASRLQTLREDIARLRFTLDRLLADPNEVQAITSLPASVIRTLGLGGAAAPIPTTAGTGAARTTETAPSTGRPGDRPVGPGAVSPEGSPSTVTGPLAMRPEALAGVVPTIGLDGSLHATIKGGLRPLDGVSDSSRRRGDEALALEGADYVADAVRLGKLLVRANRPSEAIEILETAGKSPATRYWLARAYQEQGRVDEALAIFLALSEDEKAGEYKRFAQRDHEFLEFEREFLRTRESSRRRR